MKMWTLHLAYKRRVEEDISGNPLDADPFESIGAMLYSTDDEVRACHNATSSSPKIP